jgi:hypothetical protein
VIERLSAGGWVRLVTVLAALAAGCNEPGLGKKTTAEGGVEVDAPAGEHVGEKDVGPGEPSPTLDAGPAGMPLDGAGVPDGSAEASAPDGALDAGWPDAPAADVSVVDGAPDAGAPDAGGPDAAPTSSPGSRSRRP